MVYFFDMRSKKTIKSDDASPTRDAVLTAVKRDLLVQE